MKYAYGGPVPVPDAAGELVHPRDVREFSAAPDCPPWEPLDEPAAGVPAPDEVPGAGSAPRRPAAAPGPAVTGEAATPKGM